MEQMTALGPKIEDFVVNGGAGSKKDYLPFIDVTGPFLFYP
jgi:hypothetical protein